MGAAGRARTGNASSALVSPSTQRRMTAFMRSHCGAGMSQGC